MNTEIREEIFKQAKKWVLEAGETIRTKINEPYEIDVKSNANDLVTTLDKDTEFFFATNIKSVYPDHHLLSEEGYGEDLTTLDGTVWIIDPIDGTMNFVHQKKHFAISIGIYQDGIGEIGLIYDVMADVLYHAKKNEGAYKNNAKLAPLNQNLKFEEVIFGLNHFWLCENRLVDEHSMQKFVKKIRGARTYGSAALELAYVAEGIMDGYLSMSLSAWDVAAGIVIVNEVGGITSNIDGEQINMLKKNSILTCNAAIQRNIIDNYLIKKRK
ncbi:myo-inositol-1(or 4)-monophosphatase [Virgibacillus natechei]|uniref:inositol-phosphate phosphatase n=1 Tax=Virgibacillus natechei TaxID=1216297 RepID=A0ABS4IBD1_9BACI|nr:inositol monophosphatase family protein [Virgibacillus natechei]MBP1968237.1 myo-inositol-1(or 4)-monophosphatase [Virgibacillus natechei]UZD14493.1 inositol monophosphatase family protein [Virgibacillus natechei]